MTWHIPAKTFLLGEYAALAGESAILLTTQPCFELEISTSHAPCFHKDSPAGRLLEGQNLSFSWKDPYQGAGGMGASSAQFLGCFMAMHGASFDRETLLESYYHHSWSQTGLKPSGYDVLAQASKGCVFINKNQKQCVNYTWPFEHLSFLLLHTENKLPTHVYLQTHDHFPDISMLSALADQG